MVDCYWWATEKNVQNFGDIITPHIVRKLSGMEPVNVLDKGGRYLCSGSILPDLKERDIVWGSGVVIPDDLKNVPNGVRFCAVRGPLTRDLLMSKFGQDVPEVYGDPCLLLPKLFDLPRTREFVGFVPHGTEYREIMKPGNPFYKWYSAYAKFNTQRPTRWRWEPQIPISYHPGILIDVTSGFKPVIQAISKCAYVVSSSLHALMLADALGIPNVFAEFIHHNDVDKFSWKFCDYFLSVNRPLVPPADCTESIDFSLTYPDIRFDYGKFLESCPFNFTKTTVS